MANKKLEEKKEVKKEVKPDEIVEIQIMPEDC
jgi:hypothetical protein